MGRRNMGDMGFSQIQSFKGPISYAPFENPVVAYDGHSYERSHIEEWLKKSDRSPMTNDKLPSTQLYPNHTLKAAMEEVREMNEEIEHQHEIIEKQQQALTLAEQACELQELEHQDEIIEKAQQALTLAEQACEMNEEIEHQHEIIEKQQQALTLAEQACKMNEELRQQELQAALQETDRHRANGLALLRLLHGRNAPMSQWEYESFRAKFEANRSAELHATLTVSTVERLTEQLSQPERSQQHQPDHRKLELEKAERSLQIAQQRVDRCKRELEETKESLQLLEEERSEHNSTQPVFDLRTGV